MWCCSNNIWNLDLINKSLTKGQKIWWTGPMDLLSEEENFTVPLKLLCLPWWLLRDPPKLGQSSSLIPLWPTACSIIWVHISAAPIHLVPLVEAKMSGGFLFNPSSISNSVTLPSRLHGSTRTIFLSRGLGCCKCPLY